MGSIAVSPSFSPERSGRPNKPKLLAPKHVFRRRISTDRTSCVALLHLIAHIELNAIAPALYIAGEYATYGLPFNFVHD